MLKLLNTPNLSDETKRRISKQNTSENPIPFASGAIRTGTVTREKPIIAMGLEIRGTFTVATATPAISAFGLFNLINRIDIRRDGNQPVMSLFGHALKMFHRMNHSHAMFQRDPAALGSTGAKTFSAYTELPFDLGGYASLMDATQNNSLDVVVQWGTASDLATSGAFTLSNVEVLPVPIVLDGAPAGQRGGRQLAGRSLYVKQNVTTDVQNVTAATDQFRFNLNPDRGYHGLTLMAFSDNALSNDVITNITLQRTGNTHQRWSAEQVQQQNYGQYKLASQSEFTGVYDIPFVSPSHPEQTLSIDPTQNMRVICTVANPATDRVELVQQYLTR